MTRPFFLVDVFGEAAFSGNPLAVVAAAEGLETAQMLGITRWLNFSETTFLLPPDDPEADYRVRIFSLDRELPFAGHPTLGTCHAWLEAGGQPKRPERIVQQCTAGLIPIERRDGRLAFAAPPLLRSGPVDEATVAEVADVLRIDQTAIVDAQWADNGPGWVAVLLKDAAAVLALEPVGRWPRHIDIGVVGPHPAGSPIAWELRAFFPDQNGTMVEDPVTGSLNASVAGWLYASGRAIGPYLAAQGTRLGRTGRITINRDADGAVWVAGRTRTIFAGQTGDWTA
jgi:PhzF family phenazine biosynthesis protein